MILGFLTIDGFSNKLSQTVNPIGELSVKANSYSQHPIIYSGQKTDLNIFNKGTLTTNQTPIFDSVLNTVLEKLDNIPGYSQSSGSTLNNIKTVLGPNATQVTIGASIINPIDALPYPSWVKFTYTVNTVPFDFYIWFNDADFLENYPLGSIEVYFPIIDVRKLYTNYAAANTEVMSTVGTPFAYSNWINDKIGNSTKVYSEIKTLAFKVYNRSNTAQYFELPILFACNGGPSFITNSQLFSVVLNYLLDNSTLTLEEWSSAIPDLNPSNTYYFIPNWFNIAVSNVGAGIKILSPTTTLAEINILVSGIKTKLFPNYIENDFDELAITSTLYLSASSFVLPSKDNYIDNVSWKSKVPDYFLVAVNDTFKQQMTVKTQNIITVLSALMDEAKNYTLNDSLTGSYSLEINNGYRYIKSTVEGVTLAVLTLESALLKPYNVV